MFQLLFCFPLFSCQGSISENVCFASVERFSCLPFARSRGCSIAYPLCFVKRFVEQFLLALENSLFVSIGLSVQATHQKKEPTHPREVST
jgi:hypothetical protein